MDAKQPTIRSGQRLLLRLGQVAKYVFLILLSGLVGAYGGSLMDALFDNPSDLARHWGWIIGAVIAAIGAPFGWVSFGGERKTSRSIFALPTGRKSPAEPAPSRDVSPPRGRRMGTFKAAGAGGLMGLLIGGMLGGILLMVWFSIAMRPFAPSAWNRSVT